MRLTSRRLVVCLAVLCALSGCRGKLRGVKGSGTVKSESRDVSGFTSISLATQGQVTVRQTGKESLTITAEDNLLPLLETRVAGGTLSVDTLGDVHIKPTKPITIAIEVKSLDVLTMSGAGSVDASGVKARRFSASLSGAGSMTVEGSADELELDVSGVGQFDGEKFQTKRAKVDDSGVGKAIVNVNERLRADVSGVGSVEYIGSPAVEQSVSGVGSVRKR